MASTFDTDSVTRRVSSKGTLINPSKSAFRQASLKLASRSGDTVSLQESRMGSTDVTYSSTAGRRGPERGPAVIADTNPSAQEMRSPSMSVAMQLKYAAKAYGPTRYVVAERRDAISQHRQDAVKEAAKRQQQQDDDADRAAQQRAAQGLPPTTLGVGTPGSSYALALHNVATLHDQHLNVRSVLQQVYSTTAAEGI